MRTILFCIFFALSGTTLAQKNIVISENLTSNSELLKVKMGAQRMGKIMKFSFGDYAVVSSKMGWTKSSSKTNFFSTKTETKSSQKFSFTLSNSMGDSAFVNAARDVEVQILRESEIIPFFIIGNDELLLEERNFTAFITINRDTTETWSLIMNTAIGTNADSSGTAILTNGVRKILLFTASSNKNGTDKRLFPALGYEFVENEQALCALQYYGGGALGLNKNIVWIHHDLDLKLKLILAGAMTSVMQLKLEDFTEI